METNANRNPALRGTGSMPRSRAHIMLGASAVAVTVFAISAAALLPARGGQLVAHPASAQISRPLGHAAAPPAPRAPNRSDTQRFTGRVGANLSDSLRAAGVPELQGREYVAILARAINLADGLSVDDKFDLVLLRDPDTGTLGQLVYVGMDRVARADVELMKWTDGKHIIWVNADGVGGEEQAALGLPVHGRITSPFGERYHPILGYVRMHKGVDLAAAAGTPIVAAADGKVVSAGWHGGYGEQVAIAHASGLETSYGHMSRIAARIGQVVSKGQVIGWVGTTGLSTGPHVHFEVTKNGRPVNPLAIKAVNGPGRLAGQQLERFDATLRGILLGSAKGS